MERYRLLLTLMGLSVAVKNCLDCILRGNGSKDDATKLRHKIPR